MLRYRLYIYVNRSLWWVMVCCPLPLHCLGTQRVLLYYCCNFRSYYFLSLYYIIYNFFIKYKKNKHFFLIFFHTKPDSYTTGYCREKVVLKKIPVNPCVCSIAMCVWILQFVWWFLLLHVRLFYFICLQFIKYRIIFFLFRIPT